MDPAALQRLLGRAAAARDPAGAGSGVDQPVPDKYVLLYIKSTFTCFEDVKSGWNLTDPCIVAKLFIFPPLHC